MPDYVHRKRVGAEMWCGIVSKENEALHASEGYENLINCPECIRDYEAELKNDSREPPNPVSKPPHYTAGKVECIDAIEAATAHLGGNDGFLTGQVIKYVWRWKLKNGLEDLKKAQWYLQRLIDRVMRGDS